MHRGVILISDSSDEDTAKPASTNGRLTPQIKEEYQSDVKSASTKNISNVTKSENGDDRRGSVTVSNAVLFDEFAEKCSDLVKDSPRGNDIIKFLRAKHTRASSEYKTSRSYRKLLQGFLSQIGKGSEDVYIFINDATSVLEQHTTKNCKRPSAEPVEPDRKDDNITAPSPKKRRILIESSDRLPEENITKAEPVAKDRSPVVSENSKPVEDDVPSTSAQPEPRPTDSSEKTGEDPKTAKKVKYLERLLKKFSDEISKLERRELTLEEMAQGDSYHMQEQTLKKRFMLIYKELCKIKECSVSTGRIMERRIRVKASRFEEINRKVELYINNPKRDFITRFPDFPDIYYLVKQANIKHQLNLPESQLKSIAHSIFQEVGESMQKRRHNDFVFEFGSSIIDEMKDAPDPATSDPTLEEKLRNNRKLAKNNLDAVNEKFCNMQYDVAASSQCGVNTEPSGANTDSTKENNKISNIGSVTENLAKEGPVDLASDDIITIEEDEN